MLDDDPIADYREVFKEHIEETEENAAIVYAPTDSGTDMPTDWVVFRIDMTMMPKEDREKVYQAELLLHEVGVAFDAGSGDGYREWEMDWSLSGAHVRNRGMHCMASKLHKEVPILTYEVPIYWASVLSPGKSGYSYPYCSEVCRNSDSLPEGWEVVFKTEQIPE